MPALSTPLGALLIVAPSTLVVLAVAWAVINKYRVATWLRRIKRAFMESQEAQKREWENMHD